MPPHFKNLLAAVAITGCLTMALAGAAVAGDITGYRSAVFGMSEAATRAAIAADFGVAANDIPREIHDVEKTTALKITVHGLVYGTGKAEISYLLGYRSRELFQVTILWRASNESAAAVGRLLLAAQTMTNRFALLGYPDGTLAPGSIMADGAKLLFRSRDKHGKLALIGLYSPSADDGSGSAETSGCKAPFLCTTF